MDIKNSNLNSSLSNDYNLIDYSIIISSFPNEWILLANPVVNDNNEIIKGILLLHSKDKREICYKGKDIAKEFDKITVIYTGQYNIERRVGIMKRID